MTVFSTRVQVLGRHSPHIRPQHRLLHSLARRQESCARQEVLVQALVLLLNSPLGLTCDAKTRSVALASEAIRDDARKVACVFSPRVLDHDCRQIFAARDARSCPLDLATLLQPLEGKRRTSRGEASGARLVACLQLRGELKGRDLGRSFEGRQSRASKAAATHKRKQSQERQPRGSTTRGAEESFWRDKRGTRI